MLEKFFASCNAYLAAHPAFLAKLKVLFWIKYWALTLLMAYFLFLIYRESGARRRTPVDRRPTTHLFEA